MLKRITLISLLLLLGTSCKTVKDSTLVNTSLKEERNVVQKSTELDTNLLIPGGGTQLTFKLDTAAKDSGRINTPLTPVDGTGVFETRDTLGNTTFIKTENRATGTLLTDGTTYIFKCDCKDTIATVRKYYESLFIETTSKKDSVRTEFKEVTKVEYRTPLIMKILALIGGIAVTFIGFRTYKYIKPI